MGEILYPQSQCARGAGAGTTSSLIHTTTLEDASVNEANRETGCGGRGLGCAHCRGFEYHQHQEHFLSRVLFLGQLPVRYLAVFGPDNDRISHCLAENFPWARVTTIEPGDAEIENAANGRIAAPRYDITLAVEVFQGHARTQVRAWVERLALLSRYVVNLDWSEPWACKTPDGLWSHEYREL